VNSDEILKAELAKTVTEWELLREENARLRLRIGEDLEGGHRDVEQPSLSGDVKAQPSAAVTVDSPPDGQSVLVRGSVSRQGRRVRGQVGSKERQDGLFASG
jgi:hypothetical protein